MNVKKCLYFYIFRLLLLILVAKFKQRNQGVELKDLFLRLLKDENSDKNIKERDKKDSMKRDEMKNEMKGILIKNKGNPTREDLTNNRKSQGHIGGGNDTIPKKKVKLTIQKDHLTQKSSRDSGSSKKIYRNLLTENYLDDFPMNYKSVQVSRNEQVDDFKVAFDEKTDSTIKAVVSHGKPRQNYDVKSKSKYDSNYSVLKEFSELTQTDPSKDHLEWLKEERNKLLELNLKIENQTPPMRKVLTKELEKSSLLSRQQQKMLINKVDKVIDTLGDTPLEKTKSVLRMIRSLELSKETLASKDWR